MTNVIHWISLDCNENINIFLRVCNHCANKSRRQDFVGGGLSITSGPEEICAVDGGRSDTVEQGVGGCGARRHEFEQG